MRRLVLALLLSLLLPAPAWAAVVTAATCSQSDVGAAINTAVDGDEVEIPAGTCAWTTGVNKSLTTRSMIIRGAGIGQTIIQDNSSGVKILALATASGKYLRLTGITFQDGTNTTVNTNGLVEVTGTSTQVRVDHLQNDHLTYQQRFIGIYGCVYGVLDNITSTYAISAITNAVMIKHASCGGNGNGDYNWSQPDDLGTASFLFIEDSTLTDDYASRTQWLSSTNDAVDGARFVVRYNTLQNLGVQHHGTESAARPRGARVTEVYRNTFQMINGVTATDSLLWCESGVCINHDNTVPAGVAASTEHHYDRQTTSGSPWGRCNGTSVYDGNTGTPTGYPCVDQPGYGQGILYSGATPSPASASLQAASPSYSWNNGGKVSNTATTMVELNRDFFNSAAPGYTEYTYPHPLRTAGPTADNPNSIPGVQTGGAVTFSGQVTIQ